MRLNGKRHAKLDWRQGTKVSPIERIVTWKKPKKTNSSNLSIEAWAALPDEINLRYIKVGYENRGGNKSTIVIVTNLLDSNKYDPIKVANLYAERWHIELKLRDVKTTLKMELFAVKSPEMAEKTLRMLTIVYNLIRYHIQKSAFLAGKVVWQMSFKSSIHFLTSSHGLIKLHSNKPSKIKEYLNKLWEILSTKVLCVRPFRREPRAIKRRPKPYPMLTKPRNEFQEIPHRSRYKK